MQLPWFSVLDALSDHLPAGAICRLTTVSAPMNRDLSRQAILALHARMSLYGPPLHTVHVLPDSVVVALPVIGTKETHVFAFALHYMNECNPLLSAKVLSRCITIHSVACSTACSKCP